MNNILKELLFLYYTRILILNRLFMETTEGFEITDFSYVILLTEPITLRLIESSYDLLRYMSNSLSLESHFSISFNQLSTSLNVTHERLLNAIYVLGLRLFVNIERNIDNNLLITQTKEGKQKARLLPNHYEDPRIDYQDMLGDN